MSKVILPVLIGIVLLVLFGLVMNQLLQDFVAHSQFSVLPEVEIDEQTLRDSSPGEFFFFNDDETPANAGEGD